MGRRGGLHEHQERSRLQDLEDGYSIVQKQIHGLGRKEMQPDTLLSTVPPPP